MVTSIVGARSDVNQSASVRGVIDFDPPAGTVGEARAEVTLGNYPNYYFYWGMKNEGQIVVDSIRITKGRGGVFQREFQNGLALVNPTTTTLVIPVEPGYRRIMGTLDPITNNGLPVTQVALGHRKMVWFSSGRRRPSIRPILPNRLPRRT